jgi:hypothetical protein
MLAAGGHGGNLTNNQVQSIRLDVDSPAWQVRKAAGDATGWPTAGTTTPYFPADGTPAPRHTYWFHHWVPELNRYMMFGASGMGSGAADWARLDGFDPATNTWDAAGTYANPTANSYASIRDTLTGNIWSINAQKYFNPNTQTWTTVTFTGSGAGLARSGAFDSTRNQFFGLYSGDNWSVGNSTVVACKMSTTGVRTNITFNSSAAYTQFLADAPGFLTVALTYDPDLDVFYFYGFMCRGSGSELREEKSPVARHTTASTVQRHHNGFRQLLCHLNKHFLRLHFLQRTNGMQHYFLRRPGEMHTG